MALTVGSICSGYGGLELALDLAGIDHQISWFSEIDPTANAVLDHHWPDVPNIGDINHGDPTPVDLITAGFPCQDISVAGQQAGIHGDRSGLWWRIRDVVGDLRPRWVLLENVDAIRSGATDERTIRCLCGWPHRRGGLPVLEQEPDTLDRCRDDQDGEEPTGDDASRVRRHSQTAPSSDREVGRSVDMADQRPRMPSSGRTDRPACADQVRPMPTAAAIQGDPRREPVDTNIPEGSLDGRWTPASVSDPQTNPGVECERPKSGNGYRGLPCPSCSRDLGDSPEIVTRRPWLGEVLRSLTGMGYRVRWGVVRASDAGAPHQRARWFCIATDTASSRLERQGVWRRPANGATTDTGGMARRPRPRPGASEPARQWWHGPSNNGGATANGWGRYADAVHRWEQLTRPAPPPTTAGWPNTKFDQSVMFNQQGEVNPDTTGRLNPRFVEWMLGLPDQWVSHGSRAAQLRCLGNGVVPQQAALAIRALTAT